MIKIMELRLIVAAFIDEGKTNLERFPRTANYKNMKSLEIYDLFYTLTNSVEYDILAEDKKKLNDIVDAFLDADYKYSGTMGEGVKYLKIGE